MARLQLAKRSGQKQRFTCRVVLPSPTRERQVIMNESNYFSDLLSQPSPRESLADFQQKQLAEIEQIISEQLPEKPSEIEWIQFDVKRAFRRAVAIIGMCYNQNVMPEDKPPTVANLLGDLIPNTTQNFLELFIQLQIHLTELIDLPDNDSDWQNYGWPQTPGKKFFGQAGISSLHLAIKFSRTIQCCVLSAGFASHIDFQDYDSVELYPVMDQRIFNWENKTKEILLQYQVQLQ